MQRKDLLKVIKEAQKLIKKAKAQLNTKIMCISGDGASLHIFEDGAHVGRFIVEIEGGIREDSERIHLNSDTVEQLIHQLQQLLKKA